MKQFLLSIVLLTISVGGIAQLRTVSIKNNNPSQGIAEVWNIQLPSSRPIRVACIGNSITQGIGTTNGSLYSYPSVLKQLLGDAFDVRNFGVSGRTLLSKGDYPYKNEGSYASAKAFQPDIVIIKLGTNDSKSWNWTHKSDFDNDCMNFINELRALPSKPHIFLGFPMWVLSDEPGGGISETRISGEVIPLIQTVATRENLPIIDFYTLTKNHTEYYNDGVHPNNQGAAALANHAAKRLREVLASPSYTGAANVMLVAIPEKNVEFVSWHDGTNSFATNPRLCTIKKSITFNANFQIQPVSYCKATGSIEDSRFLRKLWAEVNGERIDLIGSQSTERTVHPGKAIWDIPANEIFVNQGESFTLKSIGNNPAPSATVNPLRYCVAFPFVDWNNDTIFGGRTTRESLPMIGRSANNSQTDADAMAVVNLNLTIQVPLDAAIGKTRLRLNYTDGWSGDVGYGTGAITHTACGGLNNGISIDIILNINKAGTNIETPQENKLIYHITNGQLIMKSLSSGDRVEVMDISGQSIAQAQIEGSTAEIRLPQQGCYVVRITNTEGKQRTQKIIY